MPLTELKRVILMLLMVALVYGVLKYYLDVSTGYALLIAIGLAVVLPLIIMMVLIGRMNKKETPD